MLRLIALGLVGCASKVAPAPAQAEATPSEAPATVPDGIAPSDPLADPITVVGVIHKDGQRICDARGIETWVNLYYLAGFTPLVLDDATRRDVEALYRRPAIVFGHVTAPPQPDPVPGGGECPIYQMRSDWVITAEGMRIPRGTRAAEAVAVERVAPFDGLHVDLRNAMLQISLTNPFEVPLEGLIITVNYEGCFGKPSSDARTTPHARALPPGETWRTEAPLFIEDPDAPTGRQVYNSSSIEVRARGQDIAFDFDATFHEIGVPSVSCPKRAPKPSP